MKRKSIAILLVIFAACAGQAGGAAAADRYIFDKAHSRILFFISHMGFSTSQGGFVDFDGELVFDENAVEHSSVSITIRTASIDTNVDKLDEHLRKAEFFNVDKYPEMTFHSKKVEKTGTNTGGITGDLTLLGVTKPVTLDVVLNKNAAHPMSKVPMLGFSARGNLKRSDFGMNFLLPMVGDDVEIWIEVEASLAE